MPWEVRGDRNYYYSVERVNGKPRRVYRGYGAVGRLYELIDRQAKRARGTRRTADARRRLLLAALRAAGRGVLGWARQAVRAARLLNGEHQHKGEWRRRSDTAVGHHQGEGTMGTANESGAADGVLTEEYLKGLNDRANGGDPAALDELRGLFDRRPEAWRAVADVALTATTGWAHLLAGGQAAVAESVPRRAAEWRAGLAGPDPAPLVAAAADAAVTAWLAECYAQRLLHTTPPAKRPAALEKVAAANRQVQQALRLVMDARAAADAAAARAASAAEPPAAGPRLFGGAAG